ncbi:lycopene cyclase family protein [Rhodococcus indonesiensis]
MRAWNEPVDGGIAVLGAGLSGLSLAAHLATVPARPGPVVLVDDGARDIREAGWAFWSRRPGLLDTAVSARFARVRVHAGGRSRTLGLGRYRYDVVRGADLVSVVDEITDAVDDIGLRTGRVTRVHDGARPRVGLSDGTELHPEWVFDGRGPGSADLGDGTSPDAWLDFRGWRIRTEAPLFDPEVPTLFDFRTDQGRAASFVYVLPTDDRRALVEHTSFAHPAAGPVGAAGHDDALREYLAAVLGADEGTYVVEADESARLPLASQPPARRRGNIVRIGAAGGMLKGSSGYAYQRIQRDSEALARSLARHGHPFDVRPVASRFARYDQGLLRAVVERPAVLERAFAGLFDRSSAEPILRFLDEESSWRDEAALFASLPAAPLLRAMAGR